MSETIEFGVNTNSIKLSLSSETACIKEAMKRNKITIDEEVAMASVTVGACWPIQWGGDGGITCTPKGGRQSGGCSVSKWSGCGGNVLRKILNAPWDPATRLLHLNYGYNAANTQGANCTAKGHGNRNPSKLKDCCCNATAYVKAYCHTNEGEQDQIEVGASGYDEDGSPVGGAVPAMPVSCTGGNTLGGNVNAITAAVGIPPKCPAGTTVLALGGSILCCKNPASLPGNMACSLHVGPFMLTKHDTGGGPWTCNNGQSYQYLAPVPGPNDTCGFEALAGSDLCGSSGYFPEPCANPFAGITADTFKDGIVSGCIPSAQSAADKAVSEALNDPDLQSFTSACEKLKPGCAAVLMSVESVSVSCSPCSDPVLEGGWPGDGGGNGGNGPGGPTVTDPKFDVPTNPEPSDPGGI
jgi:hypothetical protein